MASITQETRFDLDKSKLLTVSKIRNHVLSCDSGELWVTVDGDRRDIILAHGESWRIEADAPVVIYALQPSSLNLSPPRAAASRRAGVLDFLARLARWEFPPLSSFPGLLIR